MGDVGGEASLTLDPGVQRVSHPVDGAGERRDLVTAAHPDPRPRVARADLACDLRCTAKAR